MIIMQEKLDQLPKKKWYGY